ncbi:MAG: TetR/AcrR family transcriptional regulator [Leptospiraceae bacterium]|nr:TetR/AcrR family transcriptional regulator [Leptospiraceae bacterium]MCB1304436.1 TetR/AcrR family transcriptional regulator [Leptospiraceae bacterium]
MPTKSEKENTPTRERIIASATEVFAERGIQGATTREIAAAAEINEVTLFRHFKSKDLLLTAVVQSIVARYWSSFDTDPDWKFELQIDITDFANRYFKTINDNHTLFRTFIGEAGRFPERSKMVIKDAFRPLRQSLIDYIAECQKRSLIRAELDPEVAADVLTGMLFSAMLRKHREYSDRSYIESAVQIFIGGIIPEGGR